MSMPAIFEGRNGAVAVKCGYAATRLGQLHYRSCGDGLPVILLSAAGRSSRMFANLMPRLSAEFRLIAFDTPGFGASGPLPTGVGIEEIALAFFDAMDQIGINRSAIYGLHTGNKIATAMAVAHPARVTKLILAGQSHSLIPSQAQRNAAIVDLIRDYVALPGVSTSKPSSKLNILLELLRLFGRDGHHPQLGGSLSDHLLDELEATGTSALYQANLTYDLGQGFSQIRVPTLVLEIATPLETAQIGLQGKVVTSMIPGSSLTTFQDADSDGLTLENRVEDLADLIVAFLS